jgi:hypothetical protein
MLQYPRILGCQKSTWGNPNITLNKQGRLDSSDSGQGPAAYSREYGIEPSGSIKDGEIGD